MDATTFQAEAEKYERLMFQISWSMPVSYTHLTLPTKIV